MKNNYFTRATAKERRKTLRLILGLYALILGTVFLQGCTLAKMEAERNDKYFAAIAAGGGQVPPQQSSSVTGFVGDTYVQLHAQ